MPELLRSAKLAVEKGQSQGRDETYVKQLSDYIIPNLLEALHKVTVLLITLFSWFQSIILCLKVFNCLAGARDRNLCQHVGCIE